MILRVLTVMLIAMAMGLALAHALELPGKLRLNRDAYFAVQPIYYPGFTIGGGISEGGGIILTVILLFLTPVGTVNFWLTLVALVGLIGMEVVFWVFTQPVNRIWLANEKLNNFSSDFFSLGKSKEAARPVSWTELRDRWEYSHVARAGFAFVSLLAIVIAHSYE